MKFHSLLIVAASVVALSGCGGGGSSSSTPEPSNAAPSVEVQSVSAAEGSQVTLTASATDTDGSIASYEWQQVEGPQVAFTGGDTDTISFTAPDVTEDTLLVFQVTVTDDDGATAEQTVEVTITAVMRKVTLSGKITDSPVANANVTVTIGGQTFTAQADANGDYTLELSVDNSLAGTPLLVSAQDPNNAAVQLVSYLESVEALIAAAGSDATVTNDEMFAVNVTNVTTAQAALMNQVAEDGVITDAAAYQQALKEYDESLLLTYATAIKLVVDFAAENPDLALPAGIANVTDLVNDPQAVADYYNAASAAAASTVQQAHSAIVSDPNLVSASAAGLPIAGNYFVILADGTWGQSRLIFNEDGTGENVFADGNRRFNWQEKSDGLYLTFVDPHTWTQVEQVEVNGVWEEKTVEYDFAQIKINWVKRSLTVDSAVFTDFTTKTYLDGSSPASVEEYSYARTLVKELVDASDEIVAGTYSIPLYLVNDVNGFDAYTGEAVVLPEAVRSFSAELELQGTAADGGTAIVRLHKVDGEGVWSKETVSGTWQITEGRLLVDSPVDGSGFKPLEVDLAVLKHFKTGLPYVSNGFRLPEITGEKWYASSDTAMLDDLTQSWSAGADGNVVGFYTLDWDHFSPNAHFWFELKQDQTLDVVDIWDGNGDGSISANEVTVYKGHWKMENGMIRTRRYRSNTSFAPCESPVFQPGITDDCRVFEDRYWDLHRLVVHDGKTEVHVLNAIIRYSDFWADYANWSTDPAHVFWFAQFDNRRWVKADAAPVDISAIVVNQKTGNRKTAQTVERSVPNIKAAMEREDALIESRQ